MALKTVLNKIIVEPVEAETKTASGIIIPDSAKEKPQKKGIVVATGKGKHDEPMEIKVEMPFYSVNIQEQKSISTTKVSGNESIRHSGGSLIIDSVIDD